MMKNDDHKIAYLQDFMFKVKYNKLLTKVNVRDRATKYKKEIHHPYEDDICPSCQNKAETVEHVMTCKEHEKFWKKGDKHILSIINSYSTMSKHDEWKENFFPYARNIMISPTWLDRNCAEHQKFNWKLGRMGLFPLDIKDTLKTCGIKEKLIEKCIIECQREIWEVMRNCWIYRCKKLFSTT